MNIWVEGGGKQVIAWVAYTIERKVREYIYSQLPLICQAGKGKIINETKEICSPWVKVANI